MDQLIDQGLSGGGIVPVAGGLAGAGVVVVSHQSIPHPRCQGRRRVVEDHEELADRRPQLRDGVLCRHRVIDRRRVQDASPSLESTGLAGHHLGVFEQAPGAIRSSQTIAQPDQHRGVERLGAGGHARRSLPAQVHLQAVTGLAIGQAFEGLQKRHRGQHPGRHRRATERRALVEVGEVVVAEQPVASIGQEPVERSLPEPVPENLPRVLESFLHHRRTQSHGRSLRRVGPEVVDPPLLLQQAPSAAGRTRATRARAPCRPGCGPVRRRDS